MELFLQFGHNMRPLVFDLLSRWEQGTVILSPRDQTIERMLRTKDEVTALNGSVVVDPQFYIPLADHIGLTSHTFWPTNKKNETAFFSQEEIKKMIILLRDDYHVPLDCKFFIIPGMYTSLINDDWYNVNSEVLECVKEEMGASENYLTVSISSDILLSEESIFLLIEYLDTFDVDGIYLVPEAPANSYLVENPDWLVNLLDLCAAIKLQSKKLIVGYANHQLLTLALAKVDAIAAGNWLNVRSFNPEKFKATEPGGGRRSMWYYCPQALTEYQVTYLDIAKRIGLLKQLQTDRKYLSPKSELLFTGAQPSSVNYRERDSFDHYLQCLKVQCENSDKESYDETFTALNVQFNTARIFADTMQKRRIIGKDRAIINVVEDTITSISIFNELRGLSLSEQWNQI